MLTLFHGSNNPELKRITNKPSAAGQQFGGLFFAADRKIAASHGPHVYVVELSPNDVASSASLAFGNDEEDEELIDAILSEEFGSTDDEWRALVLEEEEEAFEEEVAPEDWAEFSWEGQRVRGRIAREFGYSAVEMSDEHGTSYLVFPGTRLRAARDEDK